MKVYVTASLSDRDEAILLNSLLKSDNWEVTYDWTQHGSLTDEAPERITEVVHDRVVGVVNADVVVALLYVRPPVSALNSPPVPTQHGTHVEIGMALATGTPVILRADAEAFEQGACAFYRHPLVTIVEQERGYDGLRLEALKAVQKKRV